MISHDYSEFSLGSYLRKQTFGYVIGLDFKDLKGAEHYVLQIKLSYW